MSNYTPLGPWNNGGAPAISAAFLAALEAVLMQPSGGSESGKYFIAGPVYTSGAVVSQYMQSISRTSVPISVSIDESLQAHTGGMTATPSTGQLTSAGFQVFTLSTTGPNGNARAGGNFTIQW
jgi:hypothetical protein